MKMMISNDFSKMFEPLFEFEPVRQTSLKRFGPVQTYKCERTCLDTKNGSWETCFSLDMLPTKSDDLKIKIENKKMIINGKSETETKRDGFEIKSKHDWTRIIDIPDFVNPEKIKVKLSEKNLLKISAKKDEEIEDIEIMIE